VTGALTWFVDHLIRRQLEVRVRVHRAMLVPREQPESEADAVTRTIKFEGIDADIVERLLLAGREGTLGEGIDAFFINIWNASPVRPIGITHVWIATEPETPVLARRPPQRLEADGQWETWIEVDQLPEGTSGVEHLARVKLTNGTVIESVPRDDAGTAGFIPG
jgi:hypothetical protein